MFGMQMKREGKKLTIVVDLGGEGVPSSSGKSVVLAGTEGSAKVPGDDGLQINLNIYRKKGQQG
jgi:hypothetical protein